MRRIYCWTFVSILFALFLQGCRTRGYAGATGILPTPAADAKLSSYQPAKPMLAIADGVVGRTLAQFREGTGYRVEVREIVIAPGPRRTTLSLKAAAILEITSGDASIPVGEKRQELHPGSTLAITDDQALAIENTGSSPIHIRAYLFVAE